MDTILQSILDVAGVSAALVFDAAGRLVCHRGHAIYDRPLCEQLSGTLVKAIDSVELQQEDWETISARYADGKLMLRRLEVAGAGRHVLAVVADKTLNASFATVATRVAANKLKRALGGGASSSMIAGTQPPGAVPPPLPLGSSTLTASTAHLAGSSPHLPAGSRPGDSKPVLASSGLSWSQSSSVGLSRIAVADPASSAFLSRAAKTLARHVGPMAKVYVEEGVRRVSPDAPFSLASSAKLVEDLAGQIEDPEERETFRKAIAKG